ncbi:alpha/beta hydrolase family protein [Streptomyces sp. JV184]|uniref:alpha/beta hydrolase family protein n=1 Tax=Streptomyces sp. JV184 TaxID=858637 RepID=UPI002E77881C|nr:CocE/NonD family hydrolase [Streptomyces sp. JV184]
MTAGLVGVVLWQNSYDMDEQRVTIRHGGHTLNGVLAIPRDGRKHHGLVVYVHGDGPVDATHDDGYKPMWEANAKAGYASLSWDKPGVAGAPGDWLDQSMDDRADEAAAAIAWARARPDIDGDRIGLWGASQAGWVLPKIAAKTSSPSRPRSTGSSRAATTSSPSCAPTTHQQPAPRRRPPRATPPSGCWNATRPSRSTSGRWAATRTA